MTASVGISIRCVCLLPLITFARPALADNPCRIMAVGDSITVGYTDNPKWTAPYQFGFRSGLYTRLANSGMSFQFVGNSPEPWDGKFGVPKNVPSPDLRGLGQDHCRGYGGKGTDFIATNINAWVATDAPDVVLLMAGINDISPGSTAEPDSAEKNLSCMVSNIVDVHPNTRVIVAQITPYSTFTAAIVKYNGYIKNILVPHFVAQGKFVSTVDQYTNLLAAGTTNIDASLFANHINHPTATAYDRMAQTWFAGIQALDPLPKTQNKNSPRAFPLH